MPEFLAVGWSETVLERESLDFHLLKLIAEEFSEVMEQLLNLTLFMRDSKNLEIILENSLFLLQIENPETLGTTTF